MLHFLNLLTGTVLLRPYVFAFFAAYIISCSLQFGFRQAAVFSVAGYLIAWLSEVSSIHNGFPYGLYTYIEATKGRELWVAGVPFMDSLSYVFLLYASYSLVCLYRGKTDGRFDLPGALLSSFFFVYLDALIDPVALRGDRWFLGRIYYYPDGGAYFGVPYSNFVGWLIVGFVMACAFQFINNQFLNNGAARAGAVNQGPSRTLLGPALYYSVAIFNLAVAIYIRQYNIAGMGVFLFALPALMLLARPKTLRPLARPLIQYPTAHKREKGI
ncbi:MAG: carotenoid biosynthesis protein [Nitrospiraceae bacterium]|nr:carotenoid biosynthesis protein [Nitrospiraceae bacterium]